ncbi:MAG: T9SS type A sorting domain-containing protein [Candidatus Marinimicrobia bacterium]|nr:T9SS type A sorting domain-containing protein [Candidatus Neomarinimicrobiota bacterium]MBT4360998.1 T9SS type A sorting domain-containing protein [Candidatus Neomarinimicrobiota bacterium]MBT4714785.1 T9SS type A sorting domain-containing protein [Candidatus Neomarinimicrobiota bacterium]MBT4945614.1 T9SS type A sorting domain-containing protein [Candidatus Neomarinimicrobiota bacterium]MBT5270782.1 T9SS type A sorting domain-containing protein [Candidatus Neomarinimicrobiota bacterium]
MQIFETTITRYIVVIICLCSVGLSKDDNPPSLAKPNTVEFELFSSNNIRNWIGNQGHLSSHIPTGDAGAEWPAGSGKTAVFASGIWVLGQVNGEIRSAFAMYTSEWTPGIIPYDTQTRLPTSDVPLNTTDHQIYYIQQENSSDPAVENYNREYASWPVSDGAPAHDGEYFTDLNSNGLWDTGESFEDFDRNGSYDPPDGLLVTGEDPPLFSGDTQAWYVMNDWDTTGHNNLWGTTPLGIETQVLIYTRSDDPIYENVQFYKTIVINKGGEQIDGCYYGYWSDVDLGDANDDAGGCDSSLSLAYLYNGNSSDQRYGLRPPAVGYDMLQGPLVSSPGETTVYNGNTYADKNTIDMTAFILITKHNPFPDPENVQEAYNMAQGLHLAGLPIIDPWGNITTFPVSGDPVTDNGWTALNSFPVGDRRMFMSSGPFDLPAWDDINDNGRADFGEPGVQIIHSALIIVDGANNLDAITNLKYVSRYIQDDFDNGFETYSMEKPPLSSSAYDQEIIINWYEGADEYEALYFGPYDFEGYNIFQGESVIGPWTKLATFDLDNGVGIIVDQYIDTHGLLQSGAVQFGDDTSLEHIISIQEDVLNDGEPLVNNKQYYFALSAYAYGEDASPKTISSEKHIISIRPHQTFESAGVRDTLEVEHIGNSEVKLTVDVLDPSQLTGLNYKLGFEYDSTLALGRWHVTRRAVSFEDTAIQSEWIEGFSSNRYIKPLAFHIDGFEMTMDDISFQAPKFNHSWLQTVNLIQDTTWIVSYPAISPGGVDSLMIVEGDTISLRDFFGPLEHHWDTYAFFIREEGTQTWFDIPFEENHSVLIQGFASNFGARGSDRLADIPGIGGGSTNLEFLQSDLEIRFTEQGQLASLYDHEVAYVPTIVHVPFEVWDIKRNIQLCIGINDNNHSGGIQDRTTADWEHTLDLDWVILFDRDYEIYGSEVDSLFRSPYSGWCWQFNASSKFSIGDVVTIHFLNPVKAGVDVYKWSTDVIGTAYDEDALDMIRVFPNPYFGYQSEQSSFSEPFITFSNLPEKECTLRIYNLGGQLVKRFDHEIGTYEYWDLLNQHGWPVASGVYIVHIEVPDLGNKVLKVAILQPKR